MRLWSLRPDPATPHDGWLADLTQSEQARHARLMQARAKLEFAAGRSAVRRILGGMFGVRPREVVIEVGPRGKPALVGSPVAFNVAHSHGMILIAVTLGRRLGVDLEQVRPMADADALVERFFHPREVERYDSLAAADKPNAFWEAWTRKEAALKAVGTGVSGLETCCVRFGPGEQPGVEVLGGEAETGWTMWDVRPWGDAVGCVCVEE